MKTIAALLKQEHILASRSLSIFIMAIGMPVLLFLLFSSFEMPKEYLPIYLMTMTGYSVSSFGFFTFPAMLKDDMTTHWYDKIKHMPIPLWQYYMAKVIRVIVYFIIAIIVNFTIGVTLKQIALPLIDFIVCGSLILLASIIYLSFGLLLSQIKSYQKMSLLSNLLFFSLAILGGSWMPITLFPDWLQSICRFTPIYQSNLLVTHFVVRHELHVSALLSVVVFAIILILLALILRKRESKA